MPNNTLLVALSTDTISRLVAHRRKGENGVAAVIDRLARTGPPNDPRRQPKPASRPRSMPVRRKPRGKYRYELLGEEGVADTLGGLLADILRRFADLDSSFLEKYSRQTGRTRRFLTRDPKAIYPGREDLSGCAAEVCRGWWVGTNYSRTDVRRLLRTACRVAGIIWDVDLKVHI